MYYGVKTGSRLCMYVYICTYYAIIQLRRTYAMMPTTKTCSTSADVQTVSNSSLYQFLKHRRSASHFVLQVAVAGR